MQVKLGTVDVMQEHIANELMRLEVGGAHVEQGEVIEEPGPMPQQLQDPYPKIDDDQPLYNWWKAWKTTLPISVHANKFICKNNRNRVKSLPQL